MNKLGGLWQNKDKNGNTYFSGKVNDQKIIIFKNKQKQEGETYPDWIVYESESKKEEKQKEEDPPF